MAGIPMAGSDYALAVGGMEKPYHRNPRQLHRVCVALLALLAVGSMIACSKSASKSPDVSGNIRKSLDESGLKDVKVSEDRTNGVVTLDGHVASDAAKAQAESIAKSLASGLVVSNQVAVLPQGAESDAKEVNSDLDAGIKKNLDAALIQSKLHKIVSYKVNRGVVTLTGEVNSEDRRARVEKIAAGVPNVKQVVNEVQVNDQKATTTVKK